MSSAALVRLTVAAACAVSVVAFPAATAAKPFVAGEALVGFEPQLSSAAVRSALEEKDASVEAKLPAVPGLRLVDLPSGVSVAEAVSAFEELPGVLYAEPNYRRELLGIPGDPLFARQWALRNSGRDVFGIRGLAGADERVVGAWDQQTGNPAVTIAVVDTGLAFSHPDLDGNVWTNSGEIPANGIDDDANGYADDVHGWDFSAGDNDPSDSPGPDQGHGTEIAGVIGAEGSNGLGIAGLNWRVSLMPLRAADSVSEEIAALGYAKGEGARIVNLSAGSPQFSVAEHAAIEASPGVLFVAAAGNLRSNNDASPVYPCSDAAPNIVCVTATDQRDALASFSNIGPTSVDLAAPGENILSTFPAGGEAIVVRDGFARTPLRARWKTGGEGPKWRLTRRLHRGYSASDSPRGRYRNKTNSWIRSRAIDLSDWRACTLLTYVKLNTQRGRDRLLIEVSRDSKRWRLLKGYSGKRAGDREVDLPKKAGGDRSVFLRFRLRTDGSVRRQGVAIDDIELSCRARRNTYAYNDGTSFAAPQVAGAAGLVLAAHPAFSTGEVRAALLAGADQLPQLYGKVATAARLNVDAAVGP